jgi:hypothetical protein
MIPDELIENDDIFRGDSCEEAKYFAVKTLKT